MAERDQYFSETQLVILFRELKLLPEHRTSSIHNGNIIATIRANTLRVYYLRLLQKTFENNLVV